MKWTLTPPSVPGFYWLKISKDVPQIVEVVEYIGSGLLWYFTTRDTEGTIGGRHASFLWSGPIKEPQALESTTNEQA